MATEAVILKTKNKEGPEAACHFLLNEGFGIAATRPGFPFGSLYLGLDWPRPRCRRWSL